MPGTIATEEFFKERDRGKRGSAKNPFSSLFWWSPENREKNTKSCVKIVSSESFGGYSNVYFLSLDVPPRANGLCIYQFGCIREEEPPWVIGQVAKGFRSFAPVSAPEVSRPGRCKGKMAMKRRWIRTRCNQKNILEPWGGTGTGVWLSLPPNLQRYWYRWSAGELVPFTLGHTQAWSKILKIWGRTWWGQEALWPCCWSTPAMEASRQRHPVWADATTIKQKYPNNHCSYYIERIIWQNAFLFFPPGMLATNTVADILIQSNPGMEDTYMKEGRVFAKKKKNWICKERQYSSRERQH